MRPCDVCARFRICSLVIVLRDCVCASFMLQSPRFSERTQWEESRVLPSDKRRLSLGAFPKCASTKGLLSRDEIRHNRCCEAEGSKTRFESLPLTVGGLHELAVSVDHPGNR